MHTCSGVSQGFGVVGLARNIRPMWEFRSLFAVRRRIHCVWWWCGEGIRGRRAHGRNHCCFVPQLRHPSASALATAMASGGKGAGKGTGKAASGWRLDPSAGAKGAGKGKGKLQEPPRRREGGHSKGEGAWRSRALSPTRIMKAVMPATTSALGSTGWSELVAAASREGVTLRLPMY